MHVATASRTRKDVQHLLEPQLLVSVSPMAPSDFSRSRYSKRQIGNAVAIRQTRDPRSEISAAGRLLRCQLDSRGQPHEKTEKPVTVVFVQGHWQSESTSFAQGFIGFWRKNALTNAQTRAWSVTMEPLCQCFRDICNGAPTPSIKSTDSTELHTCQMSELGCASSSPCSQPCMPTAKPRGSQILFTHARSISTLESGIFNAMSCCRGGCWYNSICSSPEVFKELPCQNISEWGEISIFAPPHLLLSGVLMRYAASLTANMEMNDGPYLDNASSK